MDVRRTWEFVEGIWEDSILPALTDYIRIPNESPLFDPDWETHGHMDEAVGLAEAWAAEHLPSSATVEVWRIEGRTPLLFIEVPGEGDGTVMLYGHLDKQPPMEGWEPDLGPWKPVLRDGKLYGRGGADDGYAVFASVAAARALAEQGRDHPRLVMLIECSEESGSMDLPAYIEAHGHRIGSPDLVVCLDSGCGDYERLWLTTSLRGNIVGRLRVDVLGEGVHSGRASGVVPSSFRIARRLLSRIEDEASGAVLLPEMQVDIPAERVDQARRAADILGDGVRSEMPFVGDTRPVGEGAVELILNRTWRAALSVTGADGLPSVAQGGNVLRPSTALKLSMRIPPTADPQAAADAMKRALETDPPYDAPVRFDVEAPNAGWHAPPLAPWLSDAIDAASEDFFGERAAHTGEGGSIPFMGMLGEEFPEAQFVITGVLGPGSNAHGPNEFLHVRTAKRVTAAVAHLIAAFREQRAEEAG
ncbi:MAG: M20/M25/M40 family metallo-hydrolase [Myxococcota bacterium]